MAHEQTHGDEVFALTVLNGSVARYRREGRAAPALLALIEALTALQARLYAGLRAGVGPATDSQTTSTPPAEWAVMAIQETARTVAAHSPQGADALRRLAACAPRVDTRVLEEASSGGERALTEVTGIAGVPAEVAVFVLRAALQPYYAWRFGAAPGSTGDPAFPPRRRCPACGDRPLMGKHAEPDGHRFLRCATCGHEWAYPRIGCPSCGEDAQGKLESLFVTGDEGHRVYVCMNCRRFIKISDERLLGSRVYLPLEDIVTLHLDDLARERGFSPVSEEEAGDPEQDGKVPRRGER